MAEHQLELTEEMVAEKWAEVAGAIEIVTARIQNPDEFVVQQSSELAADDMAAKPYHVSHCARWCLNAGVDHLHRPLFGGSLAVYGWEEADPLCSAGGAGRC